MVFSTNNRSLPDLRETPGAGPSNSPKSAPPPTAQKQVFVHPDGEPVHFFLQPDLQPELLNNFENAITARGGSRVVSSPPKRGGFIVVDPRTPTGAKFVEGDKQELRWRVVPYTFLRASIFKAQLLKPDDLKNVKPVFEQGMVALKMHIHSTLQNAMSKEELDNFKLLITKYGGNSGASKSKADVIITSDDEVAALRKQYAHSNIHVESVAWVKSAAKKGSFTFTEGLSPEEVEVLQTKPPPRHVPRYNFNDAEERELVKFLAEFYPAESDPGRAQFRAYQHLRANLDRYPWAESHSESSWQHHYVREKERLDIAIERHLSAHPELQRTEEEAAEHREEVFGPARKRPGPPKGKSTFASDSEDARPKKRRKKRTPKDKKQEETDSEEDVRMYSSADASPRPERESKTAAKRSITQVIEAGVNGAVNGQYIRPNEDEDEYKDELAADSEAGDVAEPDEEVDELVDDTSHGSIVPDSAEPSQDEITELDPPAVNRDLSDDEIDFPETTDSFPPIRVAPLPQDDDDEDDEMEPEPAPVKVKAPVVKKGKGKVEPATDAFARAVRRPAPSRSKAARK
ncbi:hypothetical protein FRC04_001378 [Tulasnella sp. 424]|nr:hypothetical protein FRC04_001378 [Tulasnella sp. 424]KAG8968816.1 hypothetical protein FRC05_001302 [Tulasnella sp. 425]